MPTRAHPSGSLPNLPSLPSFYFRIGLLGRRSRRRSRSNFQSGRVFLLCVHLLCSAVATVQCQPIRRVAYLTYLVYLVFTSGSDRSVYSMRPSRQGRHSMIYTLDCKWGVVNIEEVD